MTATREKIGHRLKIMAMEEARKIARGHRTGTIPAGVKLRRNAACLCGSMEKYKKCCLPDIEAAGQEARSET
jgi:uncharacterized protein YchJ